MEALQIAMVKVKKVIAGFVGEGRGATVVYILPSYWGFFIPLLPVVSALHFRFYLFI
jgi:hypothetical protein